jgi:hypothetical protein
MVRTAFFSILIIFFAASITFASTEYPTNRAVQDGIGYRSNMIDPLNQFSNRQAMFWSLLERYNLISVPTDQIISGADYIVEVQKLLLKKYNEIKTPQYHYGYGICETNDYPSALDFMKAASKELGRSTDRDRLIIARHHLLTLCNIKKPDLLNFVKEFDAILSPLRTKTKYTSWTPYLDGTRYFYEESFGKSKNKFLSIKGDSSGWLKDTADYMKVRMAKQTSLVLLSQEIEKYLSLHPRGRYADTAKNLKRYVFKENDDFDSLVSNTHRQFIKLFSKNTVSSNAEKLYFLEEAISFTKAIFHVPMETNKQPVKPFKLIDRLLGKIRKGVDAIGSLFYKQKTTSKELTAHPLAIVAQLLDKIKNEDSIRADESSQIWLDRFNKDKAINENFPGLSSYFNLLLLAYEKNFNSITQQKISAKDFGLLYPDALILQARAFEKLEKHFDAAKLWLSTSLKHPQYNGLTEVATGYFRSGQFAEFAKLPASWMTTISNQEENLPYHRTEFDIDVKAFYKMYNPYRNLLRIGFENMDSLEEASAIFADDSLNPVIRFLAAEPILRSYLLDSNYSSFLDTAKRVFDSKLERHWNRNDRSQDYDLMVAYKDLLPTVKLLTLHPDDPVALTAIGFFLYSKKRYPKCYMQESTWLLKSLSMCQAGGFFKQNTEDIRPIDLFAKALKAYTLKQERTQEEAKLLRTLIYCFKGSKIYECIRDTDELTDRYPKKIREGYFERLHEYFPKEAKRTPYWY